MFEPDPVHVVEGDSIMTEDGLPLIVVKVGSGGNYAAAVTQRYLDECRGFPLALGRVHLVDLRKVHVTGVPGRIRMHVSWETGWPKGD